MGLQRFPQNDFSGGINLRDGPFELEPNEAQDGLNMVISKRGALEQRLGKTVFSLAPVGSAAFADDFNSDSRSAYSYITGATTDLSHAGTELIPATTTRVTMYRNDLVYTDVTVILEMEIDATTSVWSQGFGPGLRVDNSNYIFMNRDLGILSIKRVLAGVEGTIVSATGIGSTTGVRWLVFKISGNVVTVEMWTTDPTAGGGTPEQTLATTLTPTLAAVFGEGINKNPLWRMKPTVLNDHHYRRFSTVISGAFPTGLRADNLRPWYPSGKKYLMASVSGDIYSVGAGGGMDSRFNGSDDTVWCFESAQDGSSVDQVWAMNGTDNPQKWDGSSAGTLAWANSPPAGTMCKSWKNRMVVSGVAANPQRVFYSDIGNPESPASAYGTNWIDIKSGDDDTDPVTWLDVLDDFLIVFKRRSVWVVYDSNTFANRRLGTPGCEDRFQSSELLGRLYYLTRDGVYSFDNTESPSYASGEIAPFFAEDLNQSSIARSRLLATRDRKLLVAVPHGASTVNSRLLEMYPDFARLHQRRGEREPPWMIHDLPCASLANFRPAYDNVVVAGDSGDDELHTIFAGANDDGVAISSYWFSSWKSFISDEPKERLRRLNLLMSGHCVAEVYTDLDGQTVKFSGELRTVEDDDPLWDGGTWDGGTWDPQVTINDLLRLRPETRGRYHAVKFRNDELDSTFTLYTVEFVLRGGKEH